MKPALKAPGARRLKYDESLSNFAFNLNLRRYDPAVIFMPEGSTTHMGGTMRLGSRRTIFQTQDCKVGRCRLYRCNPC